MSPAALKYYKKWLETRFSPFELYVVVGSLTVALFVVLSVFLRLRLGNWSSTEMIALLTAMAAAAGALLIWLVQAGSTFGSWMLLENLESGYPAGRYREVWHELMIKYRGLHPKIIAGERFRSLFIAVASDIISREFLTPEQMQQMTELLASARMNPQRNGGVSEI